MVSRGLPKLITKNKLMFIVNKVINVSHLPVAATFTCPSLFNWHPDVTDCSKFYRCTWGKPQSFSCPTGTYWSQKLLTCDFQHLVKCGAASSSDTSLHSHSQRTSKNQEDLNGPVHINNDFQSQLKTPQKALTEKGSYKQPLYHDNDNENSVSDDYNKPIRPDSGHQLDIENPGPQKERVIIDSNIVADLTYNHFPLDKKSSLYEHRGHDPTEDGNWDYFYQEGQGNEDVIDHPVPKQNTDSQYSKLHNLQDFLESFLSSQGDTHQYHPSPRYTMQQQHHRQHQQETEVLAPAAAAQDSPAASVLEAARKQLFNDILVSKLLQHSQFSGYLYNPDTLVNTDGTYDIVDVQLQTPDSGHAGQFEPYRNKQVTSTDPWPLTDFFRAGYGYKRIFHDK